jgi:hypothetical protein
VNLQENEQAQELLYLICKIFYVSNHLFICPFMTENPQQNLDPWILFFKTLMDRPIIPSTLTVFTEDMYEM